MNYSKLKYEGTVKNLISDSLLNWIGKGLPEELEYRIWFSKRLDFYRNRITNIILKTRATDKTLIYDMIQVQVDMIKETDYAKRDRQESEKN